MNSQRLLFRLLLLLSTVEHASAGDPLTTLARLMDDRALAIARVDTARLPEEMTATWWDSLPSAPREPGLYYLILSAPVGRQFDVVWARPSQEEDARAKRPVVDELTLLDPDPLIRRAMEAFNAAKETPTDQHRPVVQAFADAGNAPLVLAVVPSSDQRRVLRELTPDLSPLASIGMVQSIVDHTLSATLIYDESRSLRLNLNTASNDNAQKLQQVLQQFLNRFLISSADIPVAPWEPPMFRKLLRDLQPKPVDHRVVFKMSSDEVQQALIPAAHAARSAAARGMAMSQLKAIGLAMYNFLNKNPTKAFPNAASRDADGKPLLSWRVHLLPHLGHKDLYDQFHLDEPWDSPHNRKLIEKIPAAYRLADTKPALGKTCIAIPVGDDAAFPAGRGLSSKEFTDGTSKTLIAVELDDAHAVTWTAPDDLPFDPEQPLHRLGHHYGDGFLALVGDGSARFISATADPKLLRALFSPAKGDLVP